MTKKGQLISTIFLALFIAVMIPVAIFATTTSGTTVSNRVQYYVTDLEGAFYYAITGNRLDKGTYSSFDVGYDPTSGAVTPATVFTAGWDEGYNSYLVKNGAGGIVSNQMINLPNSKGLEFDQSHMTINYYFVFINYAEKPDPLPTNPEDQRNVFVTTFAQHEIPQEQVETYWSYAVKTTQDVNISPLDLQTTVFTTDKQNSLAFAAGIMVPPVSNGTYSYIILKYTLACKSETPFKSDLNLTITLKNISNQ